MIFTKNIFFKNFDIKNKSNNLKKKFNLLVGKRNEVLESLKPTYQYSFSKNFIKRIKKTNLEIRIIGMGGSILGTKAIYKFLQHKIKKKVHFIDNLSNKKSPKKNQKLLNIIVSKSGNTLETISNANFLLKKKDKNLYITQNETNY